MDISPSSSVGVVSLPRNLFFLSPPFLDIPYPPPILLPSCSFSFLFLPPTALQLHRTFFGLNFPPPASGPFFSFSHLFFPSSGTISLFTVLPCSPRAVESLCPFSFPPKPCPQVFQQTLILIFPPTRRLFHPPEMGFPLRRPILFLSMSFSFKYLGLIFLVTCSLCFSFSETKRHPPPSQVSAIVEAPLVSFQTLSGFLSVPLERSECTQAPFHTLPLLPQDFSGDGRPLHSPIKVSEPSSS